MYDQYINQLKRLFSRQAITAVSIHFFEIITEHNNKT